MQIGAELAAKLSYYESATHPGGVLAPRGWNCFSVWGSSGSVLYISPDSIDSSLPSTTLKNGFSGAAVEISYTDYGGSGGPVIAEVMARIFPSYRTFVDRVAERFGMKFEYGPYPSDLVIYRSSRVFKYRTPGSDEGLGTQGRLKKNGSSIDGIAILVGPEDTPDLVHLSVRLPASLAELASVIVDQAERDARQRPK